MPRFAANVSMLFTEVPFLDRFGLAAECGFTAVEFLFPYAEDIDAIASALASNGLRQVLFNLPAGDFAAGDRGFANDPSRGDEFRNGVFRALEIASKLNCTKLNCLTGLRLPETPLDVQIETAAENLRFAADEAAKVGIRLVFEPLNPYDAPGFLIPTPSLGFAFLERIAHPNLSLQYDVYHAQRTEGNLTATIAERIGQIGHIQIADSPARGEPGTGEINYPFVFDAIDAAGYDDFVSLEYKPTRPTRESLAWMSEYLAAR